MSYTSWAILAMVVYGVNAVLLKLALRQVPAEVALAVTNTVLVMAGFALVVFRGQSIIAHLNGSLSTVYLGLACDGGCRRFLHRTQPWPCFCCGSNLRNEFRCGQSFGYRVPWRRHDGLPSSRSSACHRFDHTADQMTARGC